jgi:hypothetical protein
MMAAGSNIFASGLLPLELKADPAGPPSRGWRITVLSRLLSARSFVPERQSAQLAKA